MKGEDMKELMMMSSRSSPESIPQEHITTCHSWKIYENPFYYPHQHRHHHQKQQQHLSQSGKHFHQVNLPLSSRKIAASFWDLTFFKPIMDAELGIARSQIIDLKSELELERKARKKAESQSKRLAKENAEERRERNVLESVCEELARELSWFKSEVGRMKMEFEEERKMLSMAEVLREERVQMKLSEAKMLFEEKLLELEETKRMQPPDHKKKEDRTTELSGNVSGKFPRLVFSEKSCDHSNINCADSTRFASSCSNHTSSVLSSSTSIQRKLSPEPENPHIKRGIKGFVEFPRVVRAIGSKSRHWGTKMECQKAQLKILLKQKSHIRSNSIILS